MEKNRYYVTVHPGSYQGEIREKLDPNDAYYDYAIDATLDELQSLRQLMDLASEHDYGSFWEAHIPTKAYHIMNQENQSYDQYLHAIYRKIHELGTPETKRQIESLGVFET